MVQLLAATGATLDEDIIEHAAYDRLVDSLVSGAFGHVLLNWAHPHVPLQIMSLLTLLVPVVATAGAVVFLDEPVDGLQWFGMAVVLAALARVVQTSRR